MGIVVVGSANLDLVVQTERLPGPGETVRGRRHFRNPGGKGANQAVAAARLGGDVAMVARLGTDDAGQTLYDALVADGVDVSRVSRVEEAATGLAVITVDAGGENSIVLSPGANDGLLPDVVDAAADVVDGASICLLQLEIPDEGVLAAARRCGGTVILDPAPARPLAAELLAEVDVLIPNEHELAALAGTDVPDPDRLEDLVAVVRALEFSGRVVVTLGAAGAVVVDGGDAERVTAPEVDAVDTTAAGDAFRGALAQALDRGADLVEAARWGCAAGAVAATREGAQASLPTADEVRDLLGRPDHAAD